MKSLKARLLSAYEGLPLMVQTDTMGWSLNMLQHELENLASDNYLMFTSVWFPPLSVRFTLCVCVFCIRVCLCTTGQKRVSDALAAGNWSLGRLQDHYGLITALSPTPCSSISSSSSSPQAHLLCVTLVEAWPNPSTAHLQPLYTVLMQQWGSHFESLGTSFCRNAHSALSCAKLSPLDTCKC